MGSLSFVHTFCNFLSRLQMRGAEALKREGMKLWNKFKTGRPMLTEITKQLTALRDQLTRAEGVSSCSHTVKTHSYDASVTECQT